MSPLRMAGPNELATREGLEPPTCGFGDRRSAIELPSCGLITRRVIRSCVVCAYIAGCDPVIPPKPAWWCKDPEVMRSRCRDPARGECCGSALIGHEYAKSGIEPPTAARPKRRLSLNATVSGCRTGGTAGWIHAPAAPERVVLKRKTPTLGRGSGGAANPSGSALHNGRDDALRVLPVSSPGERPVNGVHPSPRLPAHRTTPAQRRPPPLRCQANPAAHVASASVAHPE